MIGGNALLLNIHVRNMALIQEADIELGPGLTVMSGETGAGKSIIIGSVNAALGGRTSADIIRKGAEYALVELTFQVENEATLDRLRSLEVGELEDGIVLVSRKIMPTRSVVKVNGETVTLANMRKIASLLIDIHGQNEHQSLLYEERHMELLDRFLSLDDLKAKDELAKEYGRLKKLEKRLAALDMDDEEKRSRVSYLEYQVGEIDAAGLKAGEDEELEHRFTRMNNSQRILEGLYEVQGLMSEGSGDTVTSHMGRAIRILGAIEGLDSGLGELAGQLREVDSLVNDFSGELSAYVQSMDFDDGEYDRTGQRLDEINTLKAKYGKTIEGILAGRDEKAAELDALRRLDEERDEVSRQVLEARDSVLSLCRRLTDARRAAGDTLAGAVRQSLGELNFLDSRFEVSITPREGFDANGQDRVSFLIATNPGEDLKPLARIASGGEMSRIMLAIKAALAGKDEIQTLIFDEIDTGISGKTASMVARKMHSIADSHQILCITHLPQIAAAADSHFLIRKDVDGGKTVTTIRRLDEAEGIFELARLLGGDTIQEAAVANAREMRASMRK